MTVEPNFWNPKRTQAKETKKHENRIANALGGRRVSGSGSVALSSTARVAGRTTVFGTRSRGKTQTADGDVETPLFHVEHKRTKAKSISVSQKVLQKVKAGASRRGVDPALALTFEGPSGNDDWVLIPKSVLARLIAELEVERG